MGDAAEQTPDIDVDALMSQVDAGEETNAPAPAAAATDAPAEKETPAPAKTPQEQAMDALEFNWNGKPIKAGLKDPKTLQWLSQGYDYAQRMAEFNQKQSAFEKQQKDFEPLKTRYSEIDAYARENPQWLEHVNQQYLAAIGKAEAQGQPVGEIQALKRELQELRTFKDELTSERQSAKAKEEDQKLDGQIQSIQEKYKDLDWKSTNELGKTLETQVLEFGIQHGIKNFEHAFKLFNHDSLITLHSARAKEEQVKSKQAQAKSGVLGQTQAPTKQLQPIKNFKSKSYSDLAREALEELGIS